jgi:hypothetical protein
MLYKILAIWLILKPVIFVLMINYFSFFYDYYLENHVFYIRLFKRFKVYRIHVKHIESIRMISYDALQNTFALRLCNRNSSNQFICVRLKRGLFKRVIITPDKPEQFIRRYILALKRFKRIGRLKRIERAKQLQYLESLKHLAAI